MKIASDNPTLSQCLGLALGILLAFSQSSLFAAEISYFKGTSNEDLDEAIIDRLTEQGHTMKHRVLQETGTRPS